MQISITWNAHSHIGSTSTIIGYTANYESTAATTVLLSIEWLFLVMQLINPYTAYLQHNL